MDKKELTAEEFKERLLAEQEILVRNQLKRIDFKQKAFMANDKIYYIEDIVNPRRWSQLLRYEVELGFGQTFENIFKQSQRGYDAANEGRLADSAVAHHNIIHMCKNGLEDRVLAAYRMCAVCMNTADENRTILTEQMIQQKINDWQEFAVTDFFDFAVNTIPGFISAYKSISLATSQPQSEKQKQN